MTPEENEPRLLAAFRRRERPAFDTLFARHAPGIFAFARRQTGSCEDAEEIVTETFAAAFVAAPQFLGRARLTTWLLTIARRRIQDRVRKGKLTTEPLTEQPLTSPAAPLENTALATVAIEAALAQLDSAKREAFLLVVAQGLTYQEAARVLKAPTGTVKWRVHEATRFLRTYLEQDYESLP